MFKHILVPTDGSAMSEWVSHRCVAMARESGAKISAIYVVPPFHVFALAPEMVTGTPEQYQEYSESLSKKILDPIRRAAQEGGVACATASVSDDHPYQAIITAARDMGCDLICMASHGRKGVQAVILGSETHKVLTHATVPVLVFPAAAMPMVGAGAAA